MKMIRLQTTMPLAIAGIELNREPIARRRDSVLAICFRGLSALRHLNTLKELRVSFTPGPHNLKFFPTYIVVSTPILTAKSILFYPFMKYPFLPGMELLKKPEAIILATASSRKTRDTMKSHRFNYCLRNPSGSRPGPSITSKHIATAMKK